MKRHRALAHVSVALTAAALVAAVAWGQRREVCCPKYDKASETTVHAVVEKVEVRYGQAEQAGVHLVVRGKDGLYDVHVGPKRYLQKLGVTFTEGDAVIVIGAPLVGAERVGPETPLDLVARTIVRGDEEVELRSEEGWPLWRARQT